jgi:hypothetical protein
MGIIITNKEIEEIKKLYLIEQNTEFKGKSFDKKMKKENKEKIFNTLDSIGSGDIFGLNKIYNYASKDAFGALLMFFDKYLNVTSKIAKAVLLSRDGYFNKSNLGGILFTPDGRLTFKTTTSNIDYLDESMGLFSGGMKLDKKLKNIRKQVKNSEDFLNTILNYIDWSKAFNETGPEKTQGESMWSSIDDFLTKKRRDSMLNKALTYVS